MQAEGSTRPFCLLSFSPLKETGTPAGHTPRRGYGYKDFRQKNCILHSIGFQLIEMDKKSPENENQSQPNENHSAEIDRLAQKRKPFFGVK